MKAFALVIVAVSLLSVTVFGEGTAVESKIKDITIYLSGARVQRTATVSLIPGTNELIFENLANDVDESSIEVQGQGNAAILSVNFRINYLKQQQPTERGRKLKTSLDSAKLKLEYVHNEISVLEQETQLMQANYKLGVNEKTDFIEDVDEWAERYRRKNTEIRNTITKLNLQVVELTSLTQQFQNELNEISSINKLPSGEIVVKVSSTSYGTADFNFAYSVINAGWSPLYSLRAQNITDPVKLDYDALVHQNTGEMWKEVKLSLSTGNPALGGNKPELNPLYLNIQEPVRTKVLQRYSEAPMTAGAIMNKMDAADKDIMQSAADYTTVSQHQLNVSFDINLRYTLLPDGTPQQVRVMKSTLPATYEYAAVPKLDKDAFLLAKVTGWEDNNILPGPANLYFEGAYIGKSTIDPSVTNDTLNLSFGRDRKINIERKLLKDFSKNSFFGGKRTQNFVYEISIKNTKNSAVTITLEDQLPVSQNKDIEVTVKETSKADYDQPSGKLSWKLNLQPNESKKLKLEYSVKYPKNKIIQGL